MANETDEFDLDSQFDYLEKTDKQLSKGNTMFDDVLDDLRAQAQGNDAPTAVTAEVVADTPAKPAKKKRKPFMVGWSTAQKLAMVALLLLYIVVIVVGYMILT